MSNDKKSNKEIWQEKLASKLPGEVIGVVTDFHVLPPPDFDDYGLIDVEIPNDDLSNFILEFSSDNSCAQDESAWFNLEFSPTAEDDQKWLDFLAENHIGSYEIQHVDLTHPVDFSSDITFSDHDDAIDQSAKLLQEEIDSGIIQEIIRLANEIDKGTSR